MNGIDALSGQNRFNTDLLVEHRVNLDDVAPKSFSTAAKVIVGIFTLGIGALAMELVELHRVTKAIDLARDIINLKDELGRLPADEPLELTIGGKKVRLEQTQPYEHLTVTIEENGEEYQFRSDFSADSLIKQLENDMVSHLEFYGRREALRILTREIRDVAPADRVSTGECRLRELSLLTLEGALDPLTDLDDLSTTSTALVAQCAVSAACGHLRYEADLFGLLDKIERSHSVNDEEVIQLLQALDDQIQAKGPASVDRVVHTDVLRRAEPKADVENAPGTATRLLLADLILNRETELYDHHAKHPEERIRHTLLAHVDTLAHLLKDPSGLQSLPEPLRPGLEDLVSGYRTIMLTHVPLDAMPERAIADHLSEILSDESNPVTKQIFVQLDLNISRTTAEASADIQQTVRERFADLMADRADDDAQADAAPEPRHGTVEWLDHKLSKSGVDLESDGYGRFMRIVLDRYFDAMPEVDQRAMLSAMLRYSPDNASPGQLLGALLKGAGPIMQKMLQGLNIAGMDPTFREALQDMKSNLAPIPENVVRAHLLHMVQSSQGRIRSIDVVRSLGAASVGQALLCRMTLSDRSTREVVVKILRPDAKLRAQREAAIFRSAAAQVNGMPVTFEGQLDRIMDELDLRVEAENIRKGQIYNLKSADGKPPAIASMSLCEFVEPTANTLVIDKAPGQTVDKYLADVDRRLGEIIDPLAASGKAPAGRIRTWTHERISQADSLERQRSLLELHHEVYERYQLLAHFAKEWVTEGIFGEGFYHGDLHAGNMMIDDGRLTVIDFGNATTLSADEQKQVTRMVASAAARDSQLFLQGYRELLSDAGKRLFKQKEGEVRAVVDDVLRCGTVEDTAKRIAVILSELQKLGLELPAPIFNFSQCQMRLQGAMEEMSGLLGEIRTAFFKAGGHSETFDALDPLALGWNVAASEDFVGNESGYNSVRTGVDAPFSGTNPPDEFGLTNFVEQSFAKVFKEGPRSPLWKANEEFMWAYGPHYDAYTANLAGNRDEAFGLVRSCAAAHRSEQAAHYTTMCRQADALMRETPPSFFDIMSVVIEQHLKSAVSRLGFRASYRYSHSDVF